MKFSSEISKASQNVLHYKNEFGNLLNLNHSSLNTGLSTQSIHEVNPQIMDQISDIHNMLNKESSALDIFELNESNLKNDKEYGYNVGDDRTDAYQQDRVFGNSLNSDDDEDIQKHGLDESKDHSQQKEQKDTVNLNQFDLLINEKTFERAFKVELSLYNEPFILHSKNNKINSERLKNIQDNENSLNDLEENLNYELLSKTMDLQLLSPHFKEFLINFESLGPVQQLPQNMETQINSRVDPLIKNINSQIALDSNDLLIKVETFRPNEADECSNDQLYYHQEMKKALKNVQSSGRINPEIEVIKNENEISFNKDLSKNIFDTLSKSNCGLVSQDSRRISQNDKDIPNQKKMDFPDLSIKSNINHDCDDSFNEETRFSLKNNVNEEINHDEAQQEDHDSSENSMSIKSHSKKYSYNYEAKEYFSSPEKFHNIDQCLASQSSLSDILLKCSKSLENISTNSILQHSSLTHKTESLKKLLTKPILNSKESDADALSSDRKNLNNQENTVSKVYTNSINNRNGQSVEIPPSAIITDIDNKTKTEDLLTKNQTKNGNSNLEMNSDFMSKSIIKFMGLMTEEMNKLTNENKDIRKEIMVLNGKVDNLIMEKKTEEEMIGNLRQKLDVALSLLKKRDEEYKQLHIQHLQKYIKLELANAFKQHLALNHLEQPDNPWKTLKTRHSSKIEDSDTQKFVSSDINASPCSSQNAYIMNSSSQKNELRQNEFGDFTSKSPLKNDSNLQNHFSIDEQSTSATTRSKWITKASESESQQMNGINMKNSKAILKANTQINLTCISEEKQEMQKSLEDQELHSAMFSNSYSRSRSNKKGDNQKENKIRSPKGSQGNKQLMNVNIKKEIESNNNCSSGLLKGSIDSLCESKQTNDKTKNFKKYSDILKKQKEIVEQNEKILQGEIRARLFKKK